MAQRFAVPAIVGGIGIVVTITGVVIIRVTSNNQKDDSPVKSQLLAASILLGLGILFAIVTFVLIFAYKGVYKRRGLRNVSIVFAILTSLLILIGAIITFVTANQLETSSPDEARNLRGAAGSMLVGFLLIGIAFVILYVMLKSQLKKSL